MTLDYQVGFNWYAEWWRKNEEVNEERERKKSGGRRPPDRLKGERESREDREKERKQIQAAYDAYKEKLQIQMARTFVQQHKSEEWFKERYDPDIRDPFRQRQAEYRRGNYAQWVSDLESGLFDDFTLEGIYKSESNGAGGVLEKEEGETTAAAEVLGVGDLLPSKGGDLRDDAALQPALLIKTIAPHVSRAKMEAFCKEHLGDGPGGFQWLSLSDPNPLKKCHRIGWVMLQPTNEDAEAPKPTDRRDGRDEEGEDGEAGVDSAMTDNTTQSAAEKALAEINGKSIIDEERGNFQCHVGVHIPATMPRKKALWDLFSAPERVARDLELAILLVSKLEQELGEEISGFHQVEERVEEMRSKGLLQPVNPGTAPSKPLKGSDDEAEEGEDGEMEDDEEGDFDEEIDDEDLLAKKKKLDLLVEYLRRVFNFCFFCVFESDSVHELARKCPGGHLRRPRASLTSSAKAAAKASAYSEPFPLKKQDSTAEDYEQGSPVAQKRFNAKDKTHHQLQRAFNWVKTFGDKIYQISEPESVDIKKLGGRSVDDALEDELKKYIKKEDESKFRCKVPECTKLFKGETFWRKHVEKRHEDFYYALKKDVSNCFSASQSQNANTNTQLNLINSYVLDPAHITPSRTDATSNGHFGSSNGIMGGTPRGFNLSTMPYGMTGMPPQPPFTTNFGQYPVTMPGAGFGPPGSGYGSYDVSGQVGPMRRSGGRFNNNNNNNTRSNAPYDNRQGKDARNARWNNGSNVVTGGGRLTPPRTGRGSIGGPPRFPDAVAGGAGANGPREAVTGRSLKSYEDLDAAGGGATELNY